MPERRRDVVSAMHPVTKLAAVVAICLSVFLVRLGGICILLTLVFLGFAAVALGSAGTVGFIALGSKLKKVFIFSLLIVLVQVLFSGQGEPLLALDALPFVVPREGIARGLLLAGRFLTSVAASYLLVLTTDPSELAYGLMRFGLPYRYGFTLVAMMRFLPVFGDEGRIVRHAQLAKGVDLEHAGIRQLPRLIRYLLLPLTVSALERVDTLAMAMEARAFGLNPRRTFLRTRRATATDWLTLGAVLLVCVLSVCLFR